MEDDERQWIYPEVDMSKQIWQTAVVVTTLAGSLSFLAGCRTSDTATVQQAPIVDGNAGNDPAMANMADASAAGVAPGSMRPGSMRPVYAGGGAAQYAQTGRAMPTRVAGQSNGAPLQSSGESYGPENSQQSEAYRYNTQAPQGYTQDGNGSYAQQQTNNPKYDANGNEDQIYADLLDPSVPEPQQAPPPLPVYEQPPAPGPDYLWTPGYWNYANTDYYYVPGNWIAAPFVGALWTPGWWGYQGRGYGWHHGYWGRHVGYYGGVNYGFGFIGTGYQGGYWNNDHFYYNRYVNHVEPRVVNNYVYQRNVTVANNTYVNNSRVSYYGGPGGLQRRPLPEEFAAQRETHMRPLQAQIVEREAAASSRQQFYAANNGRPPMLYASHPVIERNVAVPPQLARPQNFRDSAQPGGDRGLENSLNGRFNGSTVGGEQQRIQLQQRMQQGNQANGQR